MLRLPALGRIVIMHRADLVYDWVLVIHHIFDHEVEMRTPNLGPTWITFAALLEHFRDYPIFTLRAKTFQFSFVMTWITFTYVYTDSSICR